MIKGKNTITFFCPSGQDAFINSIIAEMRRHYNIYYLSMGSEYDFNESLRHSNACWFEWCVQHIMSATKMVKTAKYVCRMHSYEAFTDMPAQVNWNLVDRLIIPNRSVMEVNQFYKSFISEKLTKEGNNVDVNRIPPHIPPHRIDVIPNIIHSKFTYSNKRVYGKKICWVGHINFKKNIELAFQLFHELKKIDSEFTLHIAGDFQEPRHALVFQSYFNKYGYAFNKDIYYYNWIDDLADFYNNMDFIISSSLYESFHLSIAEAMSTGVIPLIYNWHGAEYVYPKEYTFLDFSEMHKIITNFQELTTVQQANKRKEVSDYVNSRYSHQVVMPQIKSVLDFLLYGDIVIQYLKDFNTLDMDRIKLETTLTDEEISNCLKELKKENRYGGE